MNLAKFNVYSRDSLPKCTLIVYYSTGWLTASVKHANWMLSYKVYLLNILKLFALFNWPTTHCKYPIGSLHVVFAPTYEVIFILIRNFFFTFNFLLKFIFYIIGAELWSMVVLMVFQGCQCISKHQITINHPLSLKCFRDTVSEFGLPSRVRSDKGSENVLVSTYMLTQRGIGRGSMITGKPLFAHGSINL